MTKNFLPKKIKKINGQSLVETIVAVGIMIVGITAVLTLAVISLSVSGVSKQNIIALNLAREGIEITRAVRDTHWLRDVQCWHSSNECGLKTGKYVLDYQTEDTLTHLSLTTLPGSDFDRCTNCQLLINADGLYNLTSGSPTVYKRIIEINTGASAEEKEIISSVQWKDKYGTHKIVLKTILTDWR